MSDTYGIILAGGRGARLGSGVPKQYLPLADKPLIVWPLLRFSALEEVTGIIVVVPEDCEGLTGEIISRHGIPKVMKIVTGGDTRQGSAHNALMSLDFNEKDILLFHDAARPFIRKETIIRCIEEAGKYGAAGVYVRSVDTIAQSDGGYVGSIPDREIIYCAQTPQAFRYGIIRSAHAAARSRNIFNATDDIRLVTEAGYRVKIVEGDYTNIKITTPFDLEMARFLADRLPDL